MRRRRKKPRVDEEVSQDFCFLSLGGSFSAFHRHWRCRSNRRRYRRAVARPPASPADKIGLNVSVSPALCPPCLERIPSKLLAKRAFSPTWRVLECGTRVWKRQNNPPSASAAFEAFDCRCLVFLVLGPACTAVRFGWLLSTLSRLTHIHAHILYAVFRRIKL